MKRLIIVLTILILGVIGGRYSNEWFAGTNNGMPQAGAGAKQAAEKKILYWVAPMDPNYRRDKPGKSPMGMDLIPVYEGSAEAAAGTDGPEVKITPEVVNNLGVRTEAVRMGQLSRIINTVGYLDYDETLITHIHPRTEGWIEKLLVRAEGEHVKQGQLLFELYSPALVNAQEEFLQALAGGNSRLKAASRERLVALEVPKSQIDQLEKDKKVSQYIKFFANQSGVISLLNVREGKYITPMTDVMTIANLGQVWLLAEVFERQANWVRIGLNADATLPSMPGDVLNGKVDYIYPDLDPKTRTLRVRLRFDNSDGMLMPKMYVHVTIQGEPLDGVLNIPREALIRDGNEERVILALGDGRYQARPVVAGIESGDRIEIKSGLDEGDMVVVSAQFLIDSESSLKASLQRMNPVKQQDQKASTGTMQGKDSMQSMEKQEPMGSMKPSTKNDGKMEAGKPVMGVGTVKVVKSAEHKLNITHDPIPALNWPAMTMDFEVKDGVSLEDVHPGDRIHFGLVKSANNRYVISMIHNMGGAGGDMNHD